MTFSNDIKVRIMDAQNNICGHEKCYEPIHSIHHMLPQTKYHIKQYPLFIHSPFNAIGLCEYHHREMAHVYVVDSQHAQLYEDYLNERIQGQNKKDDL